MKIILASTYVPFVHGGARNIVDWLEIQLKNHGHQVEKFYLPQRDDPDVILRQCRNLRKIELPKSDLLITFRPQAHLLRHPNKIIWFIHHIRAFYDLWNTEFRGFADSLENREIRSAIMEMDKTALLEAKRVFANSAVTSRRLEVYNQITSEVLYPPLLKVQEKRSNSENEEIVYLSRIERHKRQHLFLEALALTKSPIKGKIIGKCDDKEYKSELKSIISKYNLENRITFEDRWISEEEKYEHLSGCLGVAYFPVDEDSYGYPTLEAASQAKPVLTCLDSGGTLELIVDKVSGLVAAPNASDLARAMDFMFQSRVKAREMGNELRANIRNLGINWENTLEKLLS